MTNKKMTSWPRRMTVIALMLGLLTTGGLTTREPDRAPSSGDGLPRCC